MFRHILTRLRMSDQTVNEENKQTQKQYNIRKNINNL
jgi:hypothetical protein